MRLKGGTFDSKKKANKEKKRKQTIPFYPCAKHYLFSGMLKFLLGNIIRTESSNRWHAVIAFLLLTITKYIFLVHQNGHYINDNTRIEIK
ncbi:hypothetical protein GmHk_04G010391 [Glycine max]|uniref:Uncharacterized protein n=1 Tax=Glycine max TaxID=3847 RepID=A0A0R0KIZ9_SOYBN|nr:hypothetical protein GmHk_04G010391 [Glycine max]